VRGSSYAEQRELLYDMGSKPSHSNHCNARLAYFALTLCTEESNVAVKTI